LCLFSAAAAAPVNTGLRGGATLRAPASCCIYGGTGSGVLHGTAVISINGSVAL
jgi:hypothetical protein